MYTYGHILLRFLRTHARAHTHITHTYIHIHARTRARARRQASLSEFFFLGSARIRYAGERGTTQSSAHLSKISALSNACDLSWPVFLIYQRSVCDLCFKCSTNRWLEVGWFSHKTSNLLKKRRCLLGNRCVENRSAPLVLLTSGVSAPNMKCSVTIPAICDIICAGIMTVTSYDRKA